MAMCEAWANGKFEGNYRDFHRRIVELTEDETQQPQYNEFGGVTAAFRNQRPFQIKVREPMPGAPDPSVLKELRQLIADLNDRVCELEHKAEWAEPEKAKA
jgi:hypothetical protein